MASSFAELAIEQGWNQAEQHAQLVDAYWDVYKSAYGHRPRHIDFDNMTIEELSADFATLSADATLIYEDELRMEAEERRYYADVKRGYSQQDIILMIQHGASSHNEAIRWAKQANR